MSGLFPEVQYLEDKTFVTLAGRPKPVQTDLGRFFDGDTCICRAGFVYRKVRWIHTFSVYHLWLTIMEQNGLEDVTENLKYV